MLPISLSPMMMLASVVVLLVIIAIVMTLKGSVQKYQNFYGMAPSADTAEFTKDFEIDNNVVKATADTSAPSAPFVGVPIKNQMTPAEEDLVMKTQKLRNEDLLPKEAGNDFSMLGQNFIVSTYAVGTDARGVSMKNANTQLRSDPVIPKIAGLTPFNNSDYEQDAYRKPFEIGQ
jgi:hypothetical protein